MESFSLNRQSAIARRVMAPAHFSKSWRKSAFTHSTDTACFARIRAPGKHSSGPRVVPGYERSSPGGGGISFTYISRFE